MSLTQTQMEWKAIIDAYDPSSGETITDYCARIGVSRCRYHYFHKAIYGPKLKEVTDKGLSLVPVVVSNPRVIRVEVNHIPITYQPESINDQELERLMRICRDL